MIGDQVKLFSGTATTLTKSGDGNLTLANVNTYGGNTVINGGTLLVDGAGQLGSGAYAGDITINNAATFEYTSTANQTVTGVVGGSGTGGVVKSDTGTLDILMTATYNGPTTVNGGTLRFTNNADLSGIDFRDTNLEGASLLDAKLSGTYFPAEISATEIRLSLDTGTRLRYQRD